MENVHTYFKKIKRLTKTQPVGLLYAREENENKVDSAKFNGMHDLYI